MAVLTACDSALLIVVSPPPFWIAECFVTKRGVMMDYYEPNCHAEKSVCYLQAQGQGLI